MTLRTDRPLLCALLLLAAGGHAQAQTLGDALREHVREGIEKQKDEEEPPDEEKPAARKPPRKRAPRDNTSSQTKGAAGERQPAAPEGETLFSFSTGAEDADEDRSKKAGAKPKKKLPVRVFGKDFKLDLHFGAGVRGWFPQQYEAVDVDFANYYTFNVDVKAKIFRFLNLRRGYYESNSIKAPRTEEAAVAAQIGEFAPKAVWVLGVLGIPITRAWEPVIRYESRAFETRARRRGGVDTEVCIVPRDADLEVEGCPGDVLDDDHDRLKIISSFETFVAGVRYDHSKRSEAVVSDQKQGKIPPLFFGIGLLQYRKPYQLTIGTDVLDDQLFDGRFRGAGLALGTELGGGLDNFFGDVDVQLGLGEVSLTDNVTLNEILNDVFPNEFLVGYVLGTATLGYRWPMIRGAPTLILVPTIKAGGASFFLVDTRVNEDERATSPSVNWDFLWTASVSLLVPL